MQGKTILIMIICIGIIFAGGFYFSQYYNITNFPFTFEPNMEFNNPESIENVLADLEMIECQTVNASLHS